MRSAVPSGIAHAGQSAAVATTPPKYQDYINGSTTADGVGARGADQCGVEQSKRVGQWVCPGPSPKSARTSVGKREAITTAATTSYCTAIACRSRYSDFEADASVSGFYGYGGTQLGSVYGYAEYTRSGGQTWSKPVQFSNSRATRNVVFTGDLINAAPGATGNAVPGKFSLYNAGSIPAATLRNWGTNGYKSYDTANWDHSQVHQWSWEVAGYPGYWYIYVKSTCTHTNDKSIYRFAAVNAVPANPEAGGYRL